MPFKILKFEFVQLMQAIESSVQFFTVQLEACTQDLTLGQSGSRPWHSSYRHFRQAARTAPAVFVLFGHLATTTGLISSQMTEIGHY